MMLWIERYSRLKKKLYQLITKFEMCKYKTGRTIPKLNKRLRILWHRFETFSKRTDLFVNKTTSCEKR